jgi:hypothetical protein
MTRQMEGKKEGREGGRKGRKKGREGGKEERRKEGRSEGRLVYRQAGSRNIFNLEFLHSSNLERFRIFSSPLPTTK